MPTNDFKPFATAGGANVSTQAEYLALAALSTGWQSGKASSKEINKAVRQATFIAAALAQFVSDKGAVDVLDDGNLAGFGTNLIAALNQTSQPLDATLTALAALVGAANKLPYFNGADTAALTDLTQVGRDIIGKADIAAVLSYLGLGSGAPAIGIPFFWPSAAMPNTVMPEWASMVFLKFNNATFSATTYPRLALVFPALKLPEARGEFIRAWDDGRGVDSGRALLSTQGDAIRNITGTLGYSSVGDAQALLGVATGAFSTSTTTAPALKGDSAPGYTRSLYANFNASELVPTAQENRPRNIAFNLLVRAK